MICSIVGCTKPVGVKAPQLCYAHYQRRRNGQVMEEPIRSYAPGGIPGYIAAHQRVHKARGLATQFTCVDCNNPAFHWSLNADAAIIVDDRTSHVGRMYSLNVMDYQARCYSCHSAYDQKNGLTVRPIGLHVS